jgi:hypothetical protein
MVGYQSASSSDAPDVPAVALMGFSKAKPCDVSKGQFVAWLLSETTKNDRCTLSYGGARIEKQPLAFGQLFDEMEVRKNEKPKPEDEA